MSNKFFHGAPLLSGDNTVPGVSIPDDLAALLPTIFQACRDYGLDFEPTVVQMLSYDEMSEIAAYGGFPVRYPHWSFGMEYEELQRGYMYGMHRIFELVINNSPCYIYCLDSNALVDNVTVVAHALGHNDFFKNNVFFSPTNKGMMNQMANHGTRIRRYIARWGNEKVMEFIDHCLRIQTLIDNSKAWDKKVIKDPIIKDSRKWKHPKRLNVEDDHEYMERYINTDKWIDKQQKKIERDEVALELDIFKDSTRDIMGFMRDKSPLKPWQSDIISMLYEEAIYFAPQRLTKVGNEGHACGGPNSLIPTDLGQLTLEELVENKMEVNVWDGESNRKINNWFRFENRKMVTIETNRGYKWEGSDNHRIYDENNNWKQLKDFNVSELLSIRSSNVWAKDLCEINYKKVERFTCSQAKDILKEKYWKFTYLRAGIYSKAKVGPLISELSERFDAEVAISGKTQSIRRQPISIPSHVSEDLAQFLGYMIGDGHISVTTRSFGLTTGDLEQAEQYQKLLHDLFGLGSTRRWDDSSKNGRWRISKTSKNLQDFLVYLGLETGVCARKKEIPKCIMKSPKNVMSAFLRAYFDCDGYAGRQGVILFTSSEKLGEQVQNVLLNYGILSSRRQVKAKDPKKTHIWQVSIRSKQAIKFRDEIGFGLTRKQKKLNDYIDSHKFYKPETWVDKIVFVKHGEGTVYDITVEKTHRYVAQGFMNHNSKVDYDIMCKLGLVGLGQKSHDAGIIEYAKHKMSVLGGKYSTNPYKLGFELLQDIEERWNKGRFGTDYEECENLEQRRNWDQNLGLGKEKIFEVRKHYNDLTLIHEFFTPEFCDKHEFYNWKRYPNGDIKLENRQFKEIKNNLLKKHLNGGLPEISIVDPNYRGKGYLMLEHNWQGSTLYIPYVEPVLQSLYFFWKNDVYLTSRDKDGEEIIFCCYGVEDGMTELKTRKDHEKGLGTATKSKI